MKMTVNSMKCISWSRLAIFTAAMTVLSSCGGGQSGMKLGDDEFTGVSGFSWLVSFLLSV